MIGEKKRLQIANICYANVSGLFAYFSNAKYRGPNFTWNWFIEYCEENAEDWMFLNDVNGNKKQVRSMAKEFAREIAEYLVDRARLND